MRASSSRKSKCALGTVFWIGSLTAGDIIEWQEQNEGPAKKNAGIRLIVKSLVTEEAPHVRYADDASQVSRITTIIKKLPHTQYETLVRHIMELNGYNVPKPVETAKND